MLLTKDTNIRELLNHAPSCKSVLEANDMPCEDCPSAWGETLAEACISMEQTLTSCFRTSKPI